MKIECTIKNILICSIVCFVLVNILFIILLIIDKYDFTQPKILTEEEQKRKIINFMKSNINFNKTYEIKDNRLRYYYSTININNPSH